METSAILRQLERHSGKFAKDAVETAIAQREEVAPELLRVLEETVDRAEEFAGDGGYMAHLYAMFLLAQFREARAYPLMVRFALLPSDLLDDLCGDFVTDTLGRVLASVCGSDVEGIKSIIEDEKADEWARGAALESLVTLVATGKKSREEIVSYFASLFRGKLERRPSNVWDELANSSCDLWPGELLADIEQAYAEDLIDEQCIELDDVQRDFAKGKDELLADLAQNPHHHLVNDTVKEFGRWACFQPKKARPDIRTTKGLPKPAPKLPVGFVPVWTIATPRAERNEPCPCGSGKKYKKCCLQ
jgi:hypothetical protein